MSKKLIQTIGVVVAGAGIWFAGLKTAMAADLTVNCHSSNCEMLPFSGAALFYETDIKPGDQYSRTITINNNNNDTCSLALYTKNENDPDFFGDVLYIAIKDSNMHYFGSSAGGRAENDKNLSDLFNDSRIYLGMLPAGSAKTFEWLVSIDPSVGNKYQSKKLIFDFDMVFSCESSGDTFLRLTKTNNRSGLVVNIGDNIRYSLSVTNDGPGPAYDVIIEDVLPVFFDYQEGTAMVTGPDDTAFAPAVSGTNPLFFTIGDIEEDETFFLSYDVKILDGAPAGTYYNLAVAYGRGGDGGSRYSNTVEDPSDIGTVFSLSSGYTGRLISAVLGAFSGMVLGAATGSPSFWLALALVFIGFGFMVKRLKSRIEKKG